MAMNRKVFLSILAMDSYQRGYAPGIKGLPQLSEGTTVKIGNATLTTDSEARLGPNAESIGFYASAYQWGGETIISYRGTDFDAANGGKILNSEFIKDFFAGWSTFTGLGDRSQFRFAEAFFTSVTGAAFEFNLRNFAVDLATLDEVNSTDDSTYRVELLAPAQFHFATSLGGIDFRPEMLSASYNNQTGQLSFTVNGVRGAGRNVLQVDANGQPVLVTYSDGTTQQAIEYQSDVKTMIGLLQRPAPAQAGVMERRRTAAANDNSTWHGAAFRFAMGEAA